MSSVNQNKKATTVEPVANKPEGRTDVLEGKMISLFDGKLMVRNLAGNENSHILAKDAQLTCDGVECTIDDLRAGLRIRVTTKPGDRNIAAAVELLDKNLEFAQP